MSVARQIPAPLHWSARSARTGRFSYIEAFRASPSDRVHWIKRGVPAVDAKRLLEALAVPQAAACKALGLSVATINKKAKSGQALAQDEGERVIGVAKLVGQLEAMVEESGDPEGFDPVAWISTWLNEPLPALGGTRPIDLLDTMEGQALVGDTLARVQSGAYG